MDSRVPILLLDLDGVLNPFAAPTCPGGYQEHVCFEGEGPERYCTAHGRWIQPDVEQGNVHVVAPVSVKRTLPARRRRQLAPDRGPFATAPD